MKLLRLISLVMVTIVALSVTSSAQYTESFGKVNVSTGPAFVFHVPVDSVNTYTTGAFSLYGYDAESFVTYPLSYGKILTSAGTPKVSVYIDGSYGFSTWSVVDTILTTDSVTTYGSGTLDLNNKHYPKYRLRVIGTTGNRRDAVLDIGLYAYKKSY